MPPFSLIFFNLHVLYPPVALSAANLKAAEAWLEENAKRPGVKTTNSGLQYEILEPGEGERYQPPADGEPDNRRFLITYEGETFDGAVFERIGGEQMVAVGDEGLPGLVEALKLMRPGATWKVYLKPELAYGDRRVNATVGPNQGVAFTINYIDLRELEVRD